MIAAGRPPLRLPRFANIRRAIATSGLALGALASGIAAGQTPNVFGATVRNPGGVVPEWWNETGYNPELLNGALHLRVGSSGNFNGSPQGGRPTCDMAMLYAAKSGQALTPIEMESCALAEWEIYRGTTGDARNMGDRFVAKDTIAEFSKVVAKRIEQLGQADLFYLRAVAVQIDPVDVATGGMVFLLNWTQMVFPNDPRMSGPAPWVSYRFDEPHFRRADTRLWGVLLTDNEAGLREMEKARAGNKFNAAMNVFVFRVSGTREGRDANGPIRYLKVDLKEFGIPYQAQDGRWITVGIKQ